MRALIAMGGLVVFAACTDIAGLSELDFTGGGGVAAGGGAGGAGGEGGAGNVGGSGGGGAGVCSGEVISVRIGDNAGDTVAATEDTWLEEGSPDMPNGLDPRLDVGSYSGDHERTLLRFDLTTIPSDACVQSATFRGTSGTGSGCTSGDTVYVYVVTEPWQELTATWNNACGTSCPGCDAPCHATSAVATLILDLDETEYATDLDVGAVQAWVSEPASNHGLMFRFVDDSDNDACLHSRESTDGNRPSLEVSYQLAR